MPFYTDAYLADTHHLNAECQGAYLLLLLHCWRCNGAPLPDDDRQLARIARVGLSRWRKVVRPQLEGFFQRENNIWRQKRLEREWARACEKIEQQRQKAIKSNWVQNQRKPLANQPSESAAAPAARTPSINQAPHSNLIYHTSLSQDALSTSPPHTPALSALKPVLSDVRYFVPGGQQLSVSLLPQLRAAHAESLQLLTHMGTEAAQHCLSVLTRHFRTDGNAEKLHDYAETFAHWPADIGAATASALVALHPYPTLPSLATCIARAQPLIAQRTAQHSRIERLLERTQSAATQ